MTNVCFFLKNQYIFAEWYIHQTGVHCEPWLVYTWDDDVFRLRLEDGSSRKPNPAFPCMQVGIRQFITHVSHIIVQHNL